MNVAAAAHSWLFCRAARRRRAPRTTRACALLLDQLERAVLSGDAAAFLALSSDAANAHARARFRRHRDHAGRERASSCTNATGSRCRARCPATATACSSTSSRSSARARGSPPGASTSSAPARPGPSASGRSPTRSACPRSRTSTGCRSTPTKAFTARNLKIAAEDLELTLPEGSVFVGDTDQGVTGVVLIGRGTLNFHPAPATEKGQVRIFCGSETLETRFDAAYLRVNPAEFATHHRRIGAAAEGGRSARAAPRPGDLPRGIAEVVRPRPRRSQPRHVVAAAGARAISSPRCGRGGSTR